MSNNLNWTGDFGSDIPGASELAGAEKQLDLIEVHYTTEDQEQALIGGAILPGHVEYGDVYITKLYSAATAKLGAVRNQRKEIPKIVLTQWTRDGQNKPAAALKWTLEDCKILGLQPGTHGGLTMFRVYYKKITIDNFEMDDKGSLKPAGTYGYDRIANEAF